jgi:hypothetical protein
MPYKPYKPISPSKGCLWGLFSVDLTKFSPLFSHCSCLPHLPRTPQTRARRSSTLALVVPLPSPSRSVRRLRAVPRPPSRQLSSLRSSRHHAHPSLRAALKLPRHRGPSPLRAPIRAPTCRLQPRREMDGDGNDGYPDYLLQPGPAAGFNLFSQAVFLDPAVHGPPERHGGAGSQFPDGFPLYGSILADPPTHAGKWRCRHKDPAGAPASRCSICSRWPSNRSSR